MNITKRDENTRDWKSHREAWEQTREINMDLNEIEGGKKCFDWYGLLFFAFFLFVAFQILRSV